MNALERMQIGGFAKRYPAGIRRPATAWPSPETIVSEPKKR